MRFSMPLGSVLVIKPNPKLSFDDELDIGPDETREGVIWEIFWNDKPLPWFTDTKGQAIALAIGCQYGATKQHNYDTSER